MNWNEKAVAAFPFAETDLSNFELKASGMSLRDWFAGQALAGYFGYCHAGHQNTATVPTAEYLYQMADAMLEARK